MEIEICKPTPEQAEFQKLFQNNEERIIKCLIDETKELYDKLEAWEKCADRLFVYATEALSNSTNIALYEKVKEDILEYNRLKLSNETETTV
jgi:hypothetical protein